MLPGQPLPFAPIVNASTSSTDKIMVEIQTRNLLENEAQLWGAKAGGYALIGAPLAAYECARIASGWARMVLSLDEMLTWG